MKRLLQTLALIGMVGIMFLQPVLNIGNFFGAAGIAYAQEVTTWNNTTVYGQGNVVTHNGENWEALQENTNKEPGTSLGIWNVTDATMGTNLPPQNSGGANIPGSNTDNINNEVTSKSAEIESDFRCVFQYPSTGKFSGCIIQALYDFVFTPLQYITYIAAKFLDFFISYSINSESYREVQFIERGWTIVRDLTNIAFIFALLYIAFKFVLNKETEAKKLLINVVLVGLAINFSLFITRAIIDAGNVLAYVFYNQINVTVPESEGDSPVVSDFNEKQISAAVVSQSDPQRIIGKMENDSNSVGAAALVILAASAFALGLILLFSSMAFLFLGRTVGLMLQMLFSPLAFASKIIPGIPIKQFELQTWFNETLKLSFLAPLFIFFLYLVVLFLEAAKNVAYPATNGAIGTIISVLLPYALTWVLLKKGVDLTKGMAGEAATMIGGGLNKLGGLVTTAALGAATGGAGLALRGTAGRLGSIVASDTAGMTSITGRTLNRLANRAASSSFDFRATRLGREFQSRTGINLGNGAVPEAARGGWTGMQQAFIKKQQDDANKFAEVSINEQQFERLVMQREKDMQALRDRTGTINSNGVDIDQEYKDKTKTVQDKEKEIEEAKKAGATKKDLESLQKELKDAKTAVRQTDKYKEIAEARKAISDAKKEKGKAEKARKKAYVENGLMDVRNPFTTDRLTYEKSKRAILGDPEDKDDYGSYQDPNAQQQNQGGGAQNNQNTTTTTTTTPQPAPANQPTPPGQRTTQSGGATTQTNTSYSVRNQQTQNIPSQPAPVQTPPNPINNPTNPGNQSSNQQNNNYNINPNAGTPPPGPTP